MLFGEPPLPYRIDHIVLAEFDIDKGSCVRCRYPPSPIPCHYQGSSGLDSKYHSPIKRSFSAEPASADDNGSVVGAITELGGAEHTWEHYLGDQMLPDGAEKHSVSRTIFALNRRPSPPQSLRVPVFVFVKPMPYYCADSQGEGSVEAHEVRQISTSPIPFEVSPQRHEPFASDVPHSTGGSAHSSSHTEPLASSPSATSSWARYKSQPLPEGFFADVISFNLEGSAISVSERTGTILEKVPGNIADFTVQEIIPDDVASFSKKLMRYLRDEPWEDGIVNLDSAPAYASPTLRPVAGAQESVQMPQVAAVATPFRFAVMARPRREGGGTIGLLFQEKHFHLLWKYLGPAKAALSPTPSQPTIDGSLLKAGTADAHDAPTLWGLCAAVTKKDTTVRRGGINKSVAIVGASLELLLPFFTLVVETAERCCEVKGNDSCACDEQTEILKCAFDAINAFLAETSAKRSSQLVTPSSRYSVALSTGNRMTHTKLLSPFQLRHSCSAPLVPIPIIDVTLSRCSVTQLIESLQGNIFAVMNAVIAEKRIVVLSKSLCATHVVEAALAIGLIGSAISPSFITAKVFPYTSINHLTLFSDVPGFVVGTLNPMFESQTKWWDVLVDLDQATVRASTEEVATLIGCELLATSSPSGPVVEPHAFTVAPISAPKEGAIVREADLCFLKELNRGIVRLRVMMGSAVDIEDYCRVMLTNYVRSIVLFGVTNPKALSILKSLPVSFLRCMENPFRGRIAMLMLSDLHYEACKIAAQPDVCYFIWATALRASKSFEDFEILQIIQEMLRATASSTEEVLMLVGSFPLALSGLSPVASQMFHSSLAVRMAVVALLRRVGRSGQVGKQSITQLNNFLSMALDQASKDLPDACLAD